MNITTELTIDTNEIDSDFIINILEDKIMEERFKRHKPVTSAIFSLVEGLENPNVSILENDKAVFFRENFDKISLSDLEKLVNSK